jgi:hypothetical protein
VFLRVFGIWPFSWYLSPHVCYWCTEKVLILYSTTLLKGFLRSRNFLLDSVGSFKYWIISSANKDNLTSSFSFWISFIFFSCFFALLRIQVELIKLEIIDFLFPLLTLKKIFSDFPIHNNGGYKFIILLTLLYWGVIFFLLVSSGLLWWRGIDCSQNHFLNLLKLSCDFWLWFQLYAALYLLICVCWIILHL